MATLRSLCALILCVLAAPALAQQAEPPRRIVSLNLCTDELLMRLAAPERIASITYLSHRPGTAPPDLRDLALSIPANRGLAEEVIAQQPDLVVAGAFSARAAVSLLTRLGYRVVEFEPASDFNAMRRNIRRMGEITGESARAEAMIADIDARLARLGPGAGADSPVYADIGANLIMPGEDTLAAAIANAAGYRTLGQSLGFAGSRQVSIEQILLSRPDLISLGPDDGAAPALATGLARHPALKRLAETTRTVESPGRLWDCGSPLAVDAVERLAAARDPG